MASGIEEPVDIIYSNEGSEWHRKAQLCELINKPEVKNILWKIIPAKCILPNNVFDIDIWIFQEHEKFLYFYKKKLNIFIYSG